MSDQPQQEPEQPRRIGAKRKEIRLTVETEGGDMEVIVRELDGELRDRYMNESKNKVDMTSGKPVPKDFTGLYSSLLSKTLFTNDNRPITPAQIQKWSTTAQEELFDLAQELSGLKKNSEEKAKND